MEVLAAIPPEQIPTGRDFYFFVESNSKSIKVGDNLLGIGTDMVEIKRIEKGAVKYGQRFLQRLFTPAEIALCQARREPWGCYAARFAAKEAVLKALGTGLAGCRWTDVEVLAGAERAPQVYLSGGALSRARSLGVERVLLSISHDRGRAVAFAVAVGGEGNINAHCECGRDTAD